MTIFHKFYFPMFYFSIPGAGYHLIIVKERDCDVSKITDLIKSKVPDAELDMNVAAELSYVLPLEDVPKFENMFSILEKEKNNLKISSFGASQTTMDEVFLR